MPLHEQTRELLNAYIERELGVVLIDGMPLEHLSGGQVADALWPLNEVFRPVLEQVNTLSYQPRYEAAADEAIERYVFGGVPWDGQEPGVWRVLKERHWQALMVAMANEKAGNPVMPVPRGLPASARTGVAMLFLLHRMTLPFPVQAKGALEWPEAVHPGSLRRQ